MHLSRLPRTFTMIRGVAGHICLLSTAAMPAGVASALRAGTSRVTMLLAWRSNGFLRATALIVVFDLGAKQRMKTRCSDECRASWSRRRNASFLMGRSTLSGRAQDQLPVMRSAIYRDMVSPVIAVRQNSARQGIRLAPGSASALSGSCVTSICRIGKLPLSMSFSYAGPRSTIKKRSDARSAMRSMRSGRSR